MAGLYLAVIRCFYFREAPFYTGRPRGMQCFFGVPKCDAFNEELNNERNNVVLLSITTYTRCSTATFIFDLHQCIITVRGLCRKPYSGQETFQSCQSRRRIAGPVFA
jgi:hypothetical protein